MCIYQRPNYSTGPEAPKSCDELVCHFGASCVEVNGQAHCECPSPDCDEKNKTKVSLHRSQIDLKLYNCYNDKDFFPNNGHGHVCRQVCGSDGVTYADRCQLRTIACRQDKEITVEHLGQCKGEISLLYSDFCLFFVLLHTDVKESMNDKLRRSMAHKPQFKTSWFLSLKKIISLIIVIVSFLVEYVNIHWQILGKIH